MIAGIAASAISGYLAIAGLLRFVRTHSYDIFVVYRVLIGIAILAAIGFGCARRRSERNRRRTVADSIGTARLVRGARPGAGSEAARCTREDLVRGSLAGAPAVA